MLADKKVIGLCLTKIHDRVRGDFVEKLNVEILKAGYKLVCFNSVEDFYYDNVYSTGARSVYDRIDFSIVDGLIICADHFFKHEIVEELVDRAREAGAPVVLLGDRMEGCYSVLSDCQDALRELVNHVIQTHHVTDTFFLAGRKENDAFSEERLAVYRSALEENGIAFREENVAYGEYWEGPCKEIVQNLEDQGRMPKAFICANDGMAFGVCQKLKELGYSVPGDVIVTGFDGVQAADYFVPALTTCSENREGMAAKCVELFQKIFGGENTPRIVKNFHRPVYSESCGCGCLSEEHRREDTARLWDFIARLEAHEDYESAAVNYMLNIEDIEELYDPLSRFIMLNSMFCLNSRFMQTTAGRNWTEGDTMVIPCCYNYDKKRKTVPDSMMLPDTEGWMEDSTFYIISSIYSKDQVCGYFAVRTESVLQENFKIRQAIRQGNLVLNSLLNQFMLKKMMQDMENIAYTDATTGLLNLKGISRWFEKYAQHPENHKKTLTISVYDQPQYTYIFENHGVRDVEEISRVIADSLRKANPKDCCIGRISESSYIVINYFNSADEVSDTIQSATSSFYAQMGEFNNLGGKDYYVEVNAGCTVADAGWTGSLESFISLASGELFLNRMNHANGETVKESISHKEFYSVFNLLIDNNLFTYHFQPIVDAKTGEIYAYEALMRTAGGINLSPLDVLDIAKEFKRLGDVEHATLFNVMKRYADEFEKFKGRRVFINTIPNHFLSDGECEELAAAYHQYFDYFVFEVTEQDSSSDEELKALKRLCGESGQTQIAVDDYGTGHSNIVNLLRYTPQIIKIDRYLISGIDSDLNKQMFVKNTIEFASMNNIRVLAEGVETEAELRTVIRYGVDLIQGYYTGRPAPDPVEAIASQIQDEIISENLRLSRLNNDKQKTYTAHGGDVLNLVSLVLEKYNYINISSGEVILSGKKDCTLDVITRVADNASVKLILDDVNLAGTDEPAIQLGQGSSVEIELRGFNAISKNGIWVSGKSRLKITGEGSLLINTNVPEGVGIGSGFDDPYGAIILDQTGRIKVISSGDRLVSIGGGYSPFPIEIKNGNVEVAGSGISVVGIGSASGEALVRIGEKAQVAIKQSGNEAVGAGTLMGKARVVSKGVLNVVSDGEKSVALGSLQGPECMIKLEKGTVNAAVHCDNGVIIGALYGKAAVTMENCRLTANGEGSSVTGIGTDRGEGLTEISGGIVELKVLSANPQPFGNEKDRLVITGGNIANLGDTMDIRAENAYGQKLHQELIEGEAFEKVIQAGNGGYVYRAERGEGQKLMSVYLP